jgi:short-subunit dehydrogenase
MKKKALVSGASSGIGKAIVQALLKDGWEVTGIGRTFPEEACFSNPRFHRQVLDLLDEKALASFLETWEKKDLCLLVNCAGAAWYGPHETMHAPEIRAMTRTNLEVPMILTGALLRELRKNRGWIINIASVTAAAASPRAAAYGAAKAGLLHFSRTLFEENRKHGLRVIAVLPDLTGTNLYRHADFTVSEHPDARLLPEDVAEAVMNLLSLREGALISELVIRPQRNEIRKKHSETVS